MLTPRKKEILSFIEGFIVKNGISPSLEEIAKALGFKAKSNVHRMLVSLENDGYIRRKKFEARGITLLDPEFSMNKDYQRGYNDGLAAGRGRENGKAYTKTGDG